MSHELFELFIRLVSGQSSYSEGTKVKHIIQGPERFPISASTLTLGHLLVWHEVLKQAQTL